MCSAQISALTVIGFSVCGRQLHVVTLHLSPSPSTMSLGPTLAVIVTHVAGPLQGTLTHWFSESLPFWQNT